MARDGLPCYGMLLWVLLQEQPVHVNRFSGEVLAPQEPDVLLPLAGMIAAQEVQRCVA